jgi:hypothetical protein
MKTRILILLVISVIAAACGDNSAASRTSPVPSASPASAPTPEIGEGVPYYQDTEWSDAMFSWSYRSKDPRLVWESLRWNKKDLAVKFKDGRTLGLFSKIAKESDAKTKANEPRCETSHSFRLLSVVGNIIGFEHTDSVVGVGCAGSAYSYWRFVSIDLAKKGSISYPLEPENYPEPVIHSPTARVSLADLFEEKDIVAALAANPEVAEIISKNETPAPERLEEFIGYRFGKGALELERDFPLRFVFRGIENGKVIVRISLEPCAHVFQALQHGIDMALPIPIRLRKDILAAASRENGFLMKDAKGVLGSGYTEYEFEPRGGRQ